MVAYTLGALDVGNLQLTLQLAPRLESMGFTRYWVSEHHASGNNATPLLTVALLGGLTNTIRVGTAGVLLRYTSPVAVAQSFRTFQWLFDGRADMGVARGMAGPEPLTAALLDGRSPEYSIELHDKRVELAQQLVCDRVPDSNPLSQCPIEPALHPDLGPPQVWFMSTSASSAVVAARLGARYSYHHYYGRDGAEAVKRYVGEFKPSPELSQPDWNVCIDAFIGEDESTARASRPEPPQSGRSFEYFAGSPPQFEEYVEKISEQYQTRNIILSTLWRRYELETQVASFERAMAIVRRLSLK